MSAGVRVSLSSGDVFYVDAGLEEVRGVLGPAAYARELVLVGSRYVAAAQVAQLVVEEVPSILSPERLESEEVAA